MKKMPKIYAHRGASFDYPENTLLAFEQAVQQGADGIELDIHFTKDKKLVVCHDEQIRRTSNGEGLIESFTYEELLSFDFGAWKDARFAGQKIPLLEQVLPIVKQSGMDLNIEVKNDETHYVGIEKAVVDMVNSFGLNERVIYSSFDHTTLVNLKNYDSRVTTGALYSRTPAYAFDYMKQLEINAIHPSSKCVFTQDMCSKALASGWLVNVWTVDDPTLAAKLADAGVSALITNRPAFIRESLSK